MNPIPLASPAGDVFAYACGTCMNVRLLGESIGETDVAAQAARSLDRATRCCACRGCKAPLPAVNFGECDACAAVSQATRDAHWATWEARTRVLEAAHRAVTKDPVASDLLLLRMQQISEDEWSAGWMTGLEYILWECVIGKDGAHGLYAEQAAELTVLSQRCDGWWIWDDGARFVRLEEWRETYERTKERFRVNDAD